MAIHAENLVSISVVAGGLGIKADSDDVPKTAHFVVDGHSLIAIAHADPDSDGDADTTSIAERRMVVGRIICAGRRYLVYDADGSPDVAPEFNPTAAEILTRRELQIASLIGDGKSDKEIALWLGISGYTVREHIRRIFAKLNIGRRAAIVSYVLRQRSNSMF